MRSLPILLAVFPVAVWAEDIPLSTDVSAVTLYPQGGTVTREVAFEAPAGRHDLILLDLPRNTDLETVRVAVDGAVLGSVTARRDYVPPRDDRISDEIEAAEAEVERLTGLGMTFVGPPVDMGHQKAIYGHDPFGNLIELYEAVQ